MKDYTVKWEIQLSAENPKEAAKLALEYITSGAQVFEVKNEITNQTKIIDLCQDAKTPL